MCWAQLWLSQEAAGRHPLPALSQCQPRGRSCPTGVKKHCFRPLLWNLSNFRRGARLAVGPGQAGRDKNNAEAAFVCLFHTGTSVSRREPGSASGYRKDETRGGNE